MMIFLKTLFPLDTNYFLINHFADKIILFIYQNITHKKEGDYNFLSQEKVYASKKGFHLRRTVKLDPVAEFFVYDLVYRNRKVFRKPFHNNRYSYGYRFSQGLPVSAIEEYKSFKSAIYENSQKYKYFAKDDIKKKLLQRRQMIIGFYEIDIAKLLRSRKIEELSKQEKEYLYDLLRNDLIQEEDAKLVLTLLRDESNDLLNYLHDFLNRFPNLIKDIFFFTDTIINKDSLKDVISHFLKTNKYATEYQLFWIARILERDFSNYPDFGELLISLYDHPNASRISQAKILEIPETRFSMNDLREEHLRTGELSWLSWSAAIGCRKMDRVNRNHLLSYFKNGSPMNQLIAECMMDYEE